jgi:hypothetical protein
MPRCVDRTGKALSDKGYNLVRYPRPNIMPLDVIVGAQPPLEWLGSLSLVWHSSSEVPAYSTGDVPKFSYTRSSEFKGALGVRILQSLLRDFGVANASAQMSISSSSTLSFSFEAPRQLSVPLFSVAEYLRAGDLSIDNPAVKKYLTIDNAIESHFYVITEVLRSRKLTVRVTGSNSESIKADASALGGTASGLLDASNSNDRSIEVAFDGTADVTFAFKAFELGYQNGSWVLIGSADTAVFLSGDRSNPFGVAPVAINPG